MTLERLIALSLIACTDPCIYQKDGYCTLSRAVSGGYPSETRPCVHFLPNWPEPPLDQPTRTKRPS